MTSQIAFLLEKIRLANNDLDRDCAKIELGCYFARAGDIDSAIDISKSYRARHDFGVHQFNSISIFLLDGMIAFYGRNLELAEDRFRRGSELSAAVGLMPLAVRMNSWLAHVHFNLSNYSQFCVDLRRVSQGWSIAPSDAIVRTRLTVADAMMTVGQTGDATQMYARARMAADLVHDQLALAAIMHNRSTLLLSRFRKLEFVEAKEWRSQLFLLRELMSAEVFESYIDVRGGLYPYVLWNSRRLMLEMSYRDALIGFENFIRGELSMDSRYRASVSCDMSWCLLKIGERQRAKEFVEIALDNIDLEGQLDDRAVILCLASKILLALGDSSRAEAIDVEAARTVTSYNENIRRLSQVISDVSDYF